MYTTNINNVSFVNKNSYLEVYHESEQTKKGDLEK